jgi:hypothetical protein
VELFHEYETASSLADKLQAKLAISSKVVSQLQLENEDMKTQIEELRSQQVGIEIRAQKGAGASQRTLAEEISLVLPTEKYNNDDENKALESLKVKGKPQVLVIFECSAHCFHVLKNYKTKSNLSMIISPNSSSVS